MHHTKLVAPKKTSTCAKKAKESIETLLALKSPVTDLLSNPLNSELNFNSEIEEIVKKIIKEEITS